ncbi:MAG TPA: hypothetical protein VGL20_03420 [Candidatus Dormibacteraeota bacterium]
MVLGPEEGIAIHGLSSIRGSQLDRPCALEAVLGCIAIARVPEDVRQVAEIGDDDGVLVSVGSCVDCQRAMTGDPRLSECAGVLEDTAEVAKVSRYGRVPGSVTLFINGRGTLEELDCEGPITEVAEHPAEELEVGCYIGVNGPVGCLMQSQGSLQEFPGFGEHPKVMQNAAEVAEGDSRLCMVRAMAGDRFGERALHTCACAAEIVGIVQEPPAGVAGRKLGAFVAFDALSVERTCDSGLSYRSG